MESIIGKKYTPFDNSYGFNKSNGMGGSSLLAGYTNKDGVEIQAKVVTIVSEPYAEKIVPVFGGTRDEIFVDVEHNGDIIRTLYYPSGVQECKEYNRAEVIVMLDEVLNLGMSLRQAQLNGSDDRSGNEVLLEWLSNNLK